MIVSNVSFQGGEVEMSWGHDPREGEEREEVIPVINYWGPWEDEDEDEMEDE